MTACSCVAEEIEVAVTGENDPSRAHKLQNKPISFSG